MQKPDRIEPHAPPEKPDIPSPAETPLEEPPELEPPAPDEDDPDPGFPEIQPLPEQVLAASTGRDGETQSASQSERARSET